MNYRKPAMAFHPGEYVLEEQYLKETYYPDYTKDRNALQTLIEAVPEDKVGEFIASLMTFLYPLKMNLMARNIPVPSKIIVDCMTADPLAIMRAFLEVME